jgi:hypothetical protein
MAKRHRRVRALPGDSDDELKRQLPHLQALVRQARKTPPPCLLCGEQAGVSVHTFTPQDKAAWGIPPALLASRVYTLCPPCQEGADVQSRVLAVLWRTRGQIRAQAAFRWN